MRLQPRVQERSFQSFLGLLQDRGAWDRSKSESATVHELTTTTLSFARRLLGYTHVLEGPELSPLLLAAVGGDVRAGSVPGVLRVALELSVHHMLQHATRGYKTAGGSAAGGGGREELSALFALNNLVYVSRSLRSEPVLGRLVGAEYLLGLKQHRHRLVKEFTAARWGTVAASLRSAEQPGDANQAAMKKELKSRFKTVNALFTRGTTPSRSLFCGTFGVLPVARRTACWAETTLELI